MFTSLINVVLALAYPVGVDTTDYIRFVSNNKCALGQDYELVTRNVKFADSFADRLLAETVAIRIGSILCVDTAVVSRLQDLERSIFI